MINENFKYNILCVDDDKESLLNIVDSLEIVLDDVSINQAICVDDAYKIIKSKQVDLIISDIDMPKIDGYQFATLLSEDEKTSNIPIIFVTAIFIDEEFEKKGFELGAVDYIIKPINLNRLKQRISLYIKISKKQQELENINRNLDNIIEQKIIQIEKLNDTYNIAQDIAKIGHCEIDKNSIHACCSNEIYNIFEIEKEKPKLAFEQLLEGMEENDRNTIKTLQKELIENHQPYNVRFKITTQIGTKKYIHINTDLQAEYILMTIQDITDVVSLENSIVEKSSDITNLSSELLFMTKSLQDEINRQYNVHKHINATENNNINIKEQMTRLKKLKAKLRFQQQYLKEQKEMRKILNGK